MASESAKSISGKPHRRVAGWRQGIAAKHAPGGVPKANGEAIRVGDASLSLSKGRVGTGVGRASPSHNLEEIIEITRRLAGACPAKPKAEQGRLRPTFASQSASCQTFDDGGWDAADFRGQRPRLQLADFLTWAKTGMALFEPLTVSIRGRVPTRLRRVARWRQGIAALHSRARADALHSRASPEANGEPFEWATRP